ncbi:MAG: ABC transporter permease [Gemmatimonadales bacterium]
MTSLQRKVLRDLGHLRSQAAAIAIVMACGVALFVTMRSMHGYLQDRLTSYYEAYRFGDVFARVRRAPASVAPLLRGIPGVAELRTRVVLEVTLDVPGLAEPATALMVSIPPHQAPMLNDLHLRRGRYPAAERRSEVLISDAFARANGLGPGDSVGAVINGRWQRLRVVGTAISPEFVYEIGAGQIFPDNRRFGVFWMNRSALEAAYQMKGAFNDLVVSLAPGADSRDVIARLDRVLARYGGTGAYDRDDQLSHSMIRDEIQETQVTSILIPAILLGVTAFLLQMVLARLVATQRDQVAILKAFGYSNRAIGTHYLELAAAPVLAGAILGIASGIPLAGKMADIYARFFQFPDASFHPDPWVIATAFLICGGAALAGAAGAVRRAALLPPAEAMRPEAPPRFRPGPAERLGLQRILSPGTRIILRNIERRPWKALLSVTGIALATAIIVVTLYLFDAINHAKDVQFHGSQREDLMVVFRTPRSAAAGYELARLPGVRLVEPFRMVPVRLRAGWRTRRSVLQGLDPAGELRRILDRHGIPQRLPADGILLSEILARDLGLRPGDPVDVEVLEGRRPRRTIVLAGTVQDLIGTSAYMSREALNRLMYEGGSISGAFLRADPARMAQLYDRLKTLPAASGVAVRQAVIEGFERTIAESFRISLNTVIIFGCIIAAGIVYNGARVGLSERGRELASLRVLGFHRWEVSRILLGEQAMLTLAGIPLGFLIGFGLSALVAFRFQTDLFRLPLVVRGITYGTAALVVGSVAFLTGVSIRRRINRLDLVAVLKTRE